MERVFGRCPLRCPFDKLSHHVGCLPHDPPAFQQLFTFVEAFGLLPVLPIHLGNLPAENASVFFDDLPETLEGLLGAGPHPGVFFFVLPGAAEPQSHHRQRPGQGSADLAVSPQTSSKRSHGFDDFVVFPAQFLLPDRKNGLASVKPLHQHLGGFFLHFFLGHPALPVKALIVSWELWALDGMRSLLPKPPFRSFLEPCAFFVLPRTPGLEPVFYLRVFAHLRENPHGHLRKVKTGDAVFL